MKKVNCGKFQNVLCEATGMRGSANLSYKGSSDKYVRLYGLSAVSAAKALLSLCESLGESHHR